LNRIAVKETCITIIAKVGWIGKTIVTHYALFPKVDAHPKEHFVESFEFSAEQTEVADGCHCRFPEKLVESSSAEVVFHPPVH